MGRQYIIEEFPVNDTGEYDSEDGTSKFIVTWRSAYDLTGEGGDGDCWVHFPNEPHAVHWMFADIFDTQQDAEACRSAKS